MGAGRLAIRVTAVLQNGPPFLAIVGGVFFLANFAKNNEVDSRDLKSSKTRNVFNFGYFGAFNTPYLRFRCLAKGRQLEKACNESTISVASWS